jgi:hypothetical protein
MQRSFVAAVPIGCYNFLDDPPEEAILLLEAALIFCQEPVELIKQHPTEDRALRM